MAVTISDDEIYQLYSGVCISRAPVKKLSRDVCKYTRSQQVTHANLKQAVQQPPRGWTKTQVKAV